MNFSTLRTALLALALAVAALATGLGMPATAHHGWTWAADEQSTLDGTIQEISMAPPHPTLRVRDAAGTVWQVDLGNPTQTQRSGFKGDSAKPGDAIRILGNRHRDDSRKQIKAVRISVGGVDYVMYPERLKSK